MFSFIENAKIRYGWGFTLLKTQKNKIWLGFYSNENVKIKYGWGFILL